MAKAELYTFEGSAWCHAPRIAISETGFKDGEIKFNRVNLAEGENFNPNFLKITREGTVPVLVTESAKDKEHTYPSTITAVRELIKLAPNPPKENTHETREYKKFIDEVHNSAHDPNATFLLPLDDADRKQKADGVVGGFLAGRQKALDKFAPDAPSEFKAFLEAKQKENGNLVAFINGKADEATAKDMYGKARSLWDSVGTFLRGQVTHLLRKSDGPYIEGKEPGEADYHLITWLARIVSNAGAAPGSPSAEAFKLVHSKTGGEPFDQAVLNYWDSWTQRPSFKANGVH